MFGKENSQNLWELTFYKSKNPNSNKVLILKDKDFIETNITRILLYFRDKVETKNHTSPVKLKEDEKNYYLTITLLVDIKTNENDIREVLIQIRNFMLENKKLLGFIELDSMTPYDKAILESNKLKKENRLH